MDVTKGSGEGSGQDGARRGESPTRTSHAMTCVHPLLTAMVEKGCGEREAACTVLVLRRVLDDCNTDLMLDRHVVDRAANADLLRRLMFELTARLGGGVVGAGVFATVERHN